MIRLVLRALEFIALMVAAAIWRKNQRFKAWLRMPGVVLRSEVTGYDENFLAIEYEYTVHGKRYVGRRLNPSSTSADATTKARKYASGQQVRVYVDPADPSNCALEPSHPGGVLFVGAVGVSMCLFALIAPLD